MGCIGSAGLPDAWNPGAEGSTSGGPGSMSASSPATTAEPPSESSDEGSDSDPPPTTTAPDAPETSSSEPGSTTDNADTDAATTGAPDEPPGAEIGTFQLTYYWLADEDAYPGTPSYTLYNPDCVALATVTPGFRDAITLEGTGRLSDGRLLNYHSACGCANSPCFFEADEDHPWGYGVAGRALVPFRSIAIDDAVLTIGSAVYVAELDGVEMPGDPPYGAFTHDGCVVPDDIGGGINGAHIDFFAALRSHYTTLDGALGLANVTLHEPGARCSPYSD